MDDIVHWLRISADEYGDGRCAEAADTIDALRAALSTARADALEEAARACDVIETKLTDQWRAGYKVCDYTQGASSGANDCAAAIRALIQKEDNNG